MDIQLDSVIQTAIARLHEDKSYKAHVHSKQCLNLISDVLGKDEQTILEIKQSRFSTLTPDRIIATNKRVILIRPSFWKLYTGHTIIGPNEVSFVPYRNLISVITTRGRLFATVHLRIHGFADDSREMKKEGQINGVMIKEAMQFTVFLEEVIEALSGTDQKAKD